MRKSFWADLAGTHLLFWAGVSGLGMFVVSLLFTALFLVLPGSAFFEMQLSSWIFSLFFAALWSSLALGSLYGLFQITKGLRHKSVMEIALHASIVFMVLGVSWNSFC